MSSGAVGFDLSAQIDHPWTLEPFEAYLIPTGIHIELPEGYEAQVRPRSSLSKLGLISPVGTIDRDFRGQIFAGITNCTRNRYTINPGDRIAQLVVAPAPSVTWVEVDSLDALGKTERGHSGFGSTGV